MISNFRIEFEDSSEGFVTELSSLHVCFLFEANENFKIELINSKEEGNK